MQEAKRLEILGLLQSDGRLSAEQIAVMVGEPVEAVAAAIREMEEERVILRYHTLVDWDRAGKEQVTAWIDVKITPQRDYGFDRLAERIARYPEVRSCYLMSGTYDLAVEVQAPNLREVSRFVSERLSTLEGVASTTTHFILKRYKHDGALFGGTGDDDERLAVTP
ncbi:MAG: Lrp/AsnC family transcriptional regulator [Bacillota bacterium]